MARIEWTSYQFNEPSLINETDYSSIKINQKANPNYNPFYVETFYNKFKVGILGYIIGGPVAMFLFSVGEELSDSDTVFLEYFGGFLMLITGFFGAALFFGLFSAIPTALSYIGYLNNSKKYYSKILKNIKVSNDYSHFVDLMTKPKKSYTSSNTLLWVLLILVVGSIVFVIFSENDSNYEKTSDDATEILSEKYPLNKIKPYPKPENGYSPYDSYFGKGIYNNSTQNSFIIKNSNSTDAVVLLINAYSNRKIRNEFIRKGESFSMTGVPNGTYYLKWLSGNDWHPDVMTGNMKGGFQSNAGASQSDDYDDWMISDGGAQWTITLYSVSGGNMDTETITLDDFGN